MTQSNPRHIVSCITPLAPTNLDPLLDEVTGNTTPHGHLAFPVAAAEVPLPVELATPETVCFGARISADTPDPVALAMTLAQMADEKAATPIILSRMDYCGLERFGFRVERVVGETKEEQDASEAQIVDFWKIVLVI